MLKTNKCPVSVYLEREAAKQKSDKDMFGFTRSGKYIQAEKKHKCGNMKFTVQRDLEWVEFLKAIGGPDNLKPVGVFEPSAELRSMVRRGIPVAFRPIIWQSISQSSMRRRSFPPDYYSELMARTKYLSSGVLNEIEKDVDRCSVLAA